MWGMVAVKFVIFVAHGLRSAAVIKSGNTIAALSCYENEEGTSKIYQAPWNFECLDAVDTTLLGLSGLSIIGVLGGIIVSSFFGFFF